jgi:hypothetical protein
MVASRNEIPLVGGAHNTMDEEKSSKSEWIDGLEVEGWGRHYKYVLLVAQKQ